MAFDLSALAAGLEGLQRNVKRLEDNRRQQQILELEVARSAPMGYRAKTVPGLFGPETSLEHVGMADPRIQLQLQQSQAVAARDLQNQVAAFQALNPLQSQSAQDLAKFKAGLEQQAAERAAALESLAAAVAKAPSASTLAALPQDPAIQEAAFADARNAFARAAVVAPDLARQWSAMLPEPVRAGLMPQEPGAVAPAQPGAAEPRPSGGVSTGGRGFEGRTSVAPKIQEAGISTAGGNPPAGPQRPLSEGGLSTFIEGRLAQGIPEAQVRTEAIGRLERENAGLRAVAALSGAGRALAESRNVLSTAEITNQVDREIQFRGESKQRALAERQAGIQGDILTEKAGQEVTLPRLVGETSPPEQGAHTDQDPFYLAPVKDPKPGEPDVVPAANRDAQEASLVGDALPVRRIREAAAKVGAGPEELAASVGKNSWGQVSLGRIRQFRAAPEAGGVVARLSADHARLGDDGIRLYSGPEMRGLQPESKAAAARPEQLFESRAGFLGLGAAPAPGLTPRGLAEHLWLGSVAPGSPFKRPPSLAIVALPARLDPETQKWVDHQSAAARPEFDLLKVPIPKGNVLLLDLAAYRGER